MANTVPQVPLYAGGPLYHVKETTKPQTSQFKRRKKTNRNLIKKDLFLALKQFGVILKGKSPVTLHGKLVKFVKRGGHHVVIDFNQLQEQIVPTISGAFPYVDPTGELALAALNVLNTLVIYGIKTKKKQKSCAFDAAGLCHCKWIAPETIALITRTEVYHWHWVKDDSPVKIFDRHEVSTEESISDYIVDSFTDEWKWALLIPAVNRDAGENTMMQLYSKGENRSKTIPGYTASFAKCSKGITIAVETSILCYATFEKDHSSSFYVLDLVHYGIDNDDSVDGSSIFCIPLHSSSPVPEPLGYCVGISVSEKYGVAFYMTSLGWLYMLGLDRNDELFKKQFYSGVLRDSNIFIVAARCFDDEGIIAIHSTGDIFKFCLNEEVIMNHLVNECGNPELAKYWFWRAGLYLQGVHQRQLETRNLQIQQQETDLKQLREQEQEQKQLQRSMHHIQQQLLLHHQQPLTQNRVDPQILTESLKQLHKNVQSLAFHIDRMDKEFNMSTQKWDGREARKEKQAHNNGMMKLLRKQQLQLLEPLRQLKLNPNLPWDLGGGCLRYLTVDYNQHKELEEKLTHYLHEQTQELQEQEKNIRALEAHRIRLLQLIRSQQRSLVTLLRLLKEHEQSEVVQHGRQKQKQIKPNNTRMDPVRASMLVNIKQSGWVENTAVTLCGKFVSFLKFSDGENHYALVDVDGPSGEQVIKGRSNGIRSYFNTTGTVVIEFCHIIHAAVVFIFAYDVKLQSTINAYDFDNVTIDKCYCKWLSPEMAVIIVNSEVYHWYPQHKDSVPIKEFDLHPSLNMKAIKDYHLDPFPENWKWALVIPESEMDKSENASMELHRNVKDRNKSRIIVGYAGCFASCVKGITQLRIVHTFLCYATFEKDGSSTFHAIDLNDEPVFREGEKVYMIPGLPWDAAMNVPIRPPGPPAGRGNGYCVGIYGSEKYGFVFYLTANGWLYMFGLDRDDCVLAQQFNIGVDGSDNLFMSISGCENGEGIIAIRRNGCVVRLLLDEDIIILYLVEKVKNSELAKYWAWRSGFHEESRLAKQLQDVQYVGDDFDDLEEQLQHHAIEQGELEGSLQQLEEHLKLHQRQHQHIRRSLRLQLQDVTSEQIKVIGQQGKNLGEIEGECQKHFEDHTRRQAEQEYNRKWKQQQRRHQQQLRGPLEHLKKVYSIDNEQMRYCTLEYPRHISIQQELQNRMEEKRERLQAEMVIMQHQVEKIQEQLNQQQQRHRRMQQKIMELGEQQMNPPERCNEIAAQQNDNLDASNDSGVSSCSTSSLNGENLGASNEVVKPGEGIGLSDDNGMSSKAEPDKQMCIICFDHPFDTVLLPCRHMWLCHECAKALFEEGKACPACRTKVEDIIPVFFPN